MARPPEPEKRRALAQRAIAVLTREGLDLSMTKLAEALELKRPTLLYHFPTKSHLFELALEELLTEQARFVLARVAEHDHPIDRLDAQIRAVHAFHHGREHRVLLLSQAIATSGSSRMTEIIALGNHVFEAHRRAAADALRAGIEGGTVAPCDVDALMASVRAMTDGLIVQRVMTGLELPRVHDFFWEHVLAPLKREARVSPPPCSPRLSSPSAQ